jgi:rod shape-determining protein MreD
MKVLRGAALAVLLVLAAIVQLAVPALTSTGYAAPYPVPALVFGAAAIGGPRVGAWTGLGAGAVLDLAPPAEHPLGQWAFVLGACGALLGTVMRVVRHWIWYVMAAAVSAVLAQLLFTGLGLALGDVHARTDETLRALPAVAVWTAGCLLVLLPAMRRLIRPDVSLVR